jgi:hypothetical protein
VAVEVAVAVGARVAVAVEVAVAVGARVAVAVEVAVAVAVWVAVAVGAGVAVRVGITRLTRFVGLIVLTAIASGGGDELVFARSSAATRPSPI